MLGLLNTNGFTALYPQAAVTDEQIKHIAIIPYFCYFLYHSCYFEAPFVPYFSFLFLSLLFWRLIGCSSSVILGQTVWSSLSRRHQMSELSLDTGNHRSIWFCINLKKVKWSLNLINIPFLELLMESIDKVKANTILDLYSHTNRYYSLICTGHNLNSACAPATNSCICQWI